MSCMWSSFHSAWHFHSWIFCYLATSQKTWPVFHGALTEGKYSSTQLSVHTVWIDQRVWFITLTSCYLILQHHHLGQLICFVVIGAWLKPVAPLGQFCPHFSLPQCPQTLCEEPVCGLCVCVFLQPLKKTLIPVVFVPCSFYMSYSFYLCLLRFISLISILHFVFLHIYFDGTALEVH